MNRPFRFPFLASVFTAAVLAMALHSAEPPLGRQGNPPSKSVSAAQTKPSNEKIPLSKESLACLECHQESATPAATKQWAGSRHAAAGVGCYECHRADKGTPTAFDHNGFSISVLVSPKDCGRCHAKETREFEASHHARAGEILGSLDNVLGDVVEGIPAGNSGCKQCHGGLVKVVGPGKLDAATWPNTGIGRINPDGSRGSCSACHSRHAFSSSVARQPENCGKCHLGPDHPQAEIYNESKHGIAFRAKIGEMNLDSKSWVLGKDYSAAPTCATCHISATQELPLTHDVGARISWTLRPEVSQKLDHWETRRADMQKVCANCHGSDWVQGHYTQYAAAVNLYNEKLAIPAKAIMRKLRDAGKLTPTPFDEKLEWTYFELWHHEGRRARMGAAMMGPDYTQWHGFYEVAKTFYTEFLPQAEALLPGVTAEARAMDDHKWLQGLSPEDRAKIENYYQKRYGK